MIEVSLSTSQLISYVVEHYIKYNFTPLNDSLLEGSDKATHIYQNGLHLNLGKNVDHTEYCLWLAANSPYYGVITKDTYTLKGIRKYYRPEMFKHTVVPRTVQLKISDLPADTEVLVLMNSTQFSGTKMRKILYSWTTEKPILFLG